MVKNPPANAGDAGHFGFDSGSGSSPGELGNLATRFVFLPEKSHGQGSLAGCNPWGRKESETAEHVGMQYYT